MSHRHNTVDEFNRRIAHELGATRTMESMEHHNPCSMPIPARHGCHLGTACTCGPTASVGCAFGYIC